MVNYQHRKEGQEDSLSQEALEFEHAHTVVQVPRPEKLTEKDVTSHRNEVYIKVTEALLIEHEDEEESLMACFPTLNSSMIYATATIET